MQNTDLIIEDSVKRDGMWRAEVRERVTGNAVYRTALCMTQREAWLRAGRYIEQTVQAALAASRAQSPVVAPAKRRIQVQVGQC